MWGIGVLLYFLATFTFPFAVTTEIEKDFEGKKHLKALKDKFSEPFIQLLDGLLQPDVTQRSTIE